MLRYSLLFLLLITYGSALATQKCKSKSSSSSSSSSGLFSRDYSSINSTSSYKSNLSPSSHGAVKPITLRRTKPRKPRVEKSEFSYGLSFLKTTGIDKMKATGGQVSYMRSLKNGSGFYYGVSAGAWRYGSHKKFFLNNDYDYPRVYTTHNIYSTSLRLKQRIVSNDHINAFFGVQTGLLFFHTFSRGMTPMIECPDEFYGDRLYSESTVKSSIGPTFDMQIPLGSQFDRLTINVGYQIPGRTAFVREGDVRVESPSQISYFETQQQLNMLSFQIGFSHFF